MNPEFKSASRSFYIQIAFLVGASFVIYSNTLLNNFVFDDIGQVLENKWIRDIRYIHEIFISNVWEFQGQATNYYRPIMHVIYMINYYCYGLNPIGFHFTNVFFHAAVSVLVFLIAAKLFGKYPIENPGAFLNPSFIIGMLFVTHPIHTEPVAWVAGIPDISFTFFYILSFYLYICSNNEKIFHFRFVLSLVTFFLALLSKETAITLPVMIVAYDYLYKEYDISCLYRYRIKHYAFYMIVMLAYFSLRFYALGGITPVKVQVNANQVLGIFDIFPLFIKYLEKLILPINLNILHVYHPVKSFFEFKFLYSVAITLLVVVLIFVWTNRNKIVLLFTFFICVPLVPALYFPALNIRYYNSFAERYLYLPSVGFVMLVYYMVRLIYDNRKYHPFIMNSIFIVLIMSYSVVSINRNAIWREELTLWNDSIKKSPESSLAQYNYGNALKSLGKIDEAMEHIQIAIKLQPEIGHYRNSLAELYINKGHINQAIQQYLVAIDLQPEDAQAYNNLATVYAEYGALNKAIIYFEKAVFHQPYNADYHYNLGVTYSDIGLVDKAIEHLEFAVKLNPGDPVYRETLDRTNRIVTR
jgi:tetratricopeptide (TPR) repeat protein